MRRMEYMCNSGIRDLLNKRIIDMTGAEFLALNQHVLLGHSKEEDQPVVISKERKYVYGLAGIAGLFGCSISTAKKIKKSGALDSCLVQAGRKIIVDAEQALEQANVKLNPNMRRLRKKR